MITSYARHARVLALLTGFFLVSGPARAEIQKMNYEVYAGGINAVDAEFDVITLPKNRYKMELSAATKGFLKFLAPWKGTFETEGWRHNEGVDQPQLHRSVATWRNDDEIKEYSYDSKGHFLGYSLKDQKNDGKKKDVDPALTEGTIDVLTAALAIMKQVAAGQPCAGSSEIFDGDRRFEMTFRSQGEEELKASRYNVYEGPAQRCDVEVKPKGGLWHEKPRGWLSIQEQGRQHGMLPTVWFARIDNKGPAVPVKIMIKSDYGAMLMHLAGYSNGGDTKAADVVGEEKSEREGIVTPIRKADVSPAPKKKEPASPKERFQE